MRNYSKLVLGCVVGSMFSGCSWMIDLPEVVDNIDASGGHSGKSSGGAGGVSGKSNGGATLGSAGQVGSGGTSSTSAGGASGVAGTENGTIGEAGGHSGGSSGASGVSAGGGTGSGAGGTAGSNSAIGGSPTGGVAGAATNGGAATGGAPQGGVAGIVGVSGKASTGGTSATGGTSGCTIGSTIYSSGQKNPGNDCTSCQPAISTSAWATLTDGTSCGSVLGKICHSGVCKTGCVVGSSYYDTGTVNPNNPCLTCQSTMSATAWSNVPTSRCVQAIAAGVSHTCAVINGAAHCWGSNSQGQLGANSAATYSVSPLQVQGLESGTTAISAGDYSSCAVVNGSAQCWGYNQAGQLGNNSTVSSPIPVQVQNLTWGTVGIAVSYDHGCANFGTYVGCWGGGYLGNNSTASSLVPVAVQGIPIGASVTAVVAGDSVNSCAIVNGGAKCWGIGNQGVIGNGSTANVLTATDVTGLNAGVTAISAGIGTHVCAVVYGSAQCWGHNMYRELGAGSTATYSALPLQVQGLTSGVTAIAAGGSFSCAIVNGAVQCWGLNMNYTLGDGSYTNRTAPVQVQGITANATAVTAGADHACAIVNGSAYCWGDNSYGQLGDGTTTVGKVPVLVKLP